MTDELMTLEIISIKNINNQRRKLKKTVNYALCE
jgi:hypothetical protein